MTNELPVQVPSIYPKNVFEIRSFQDFVAFVYVIVPLAQVLLVFYGVADQQEVAIWVAFGLGILQLIGQWTRTQEFARRAIYTVILLGNAVLIFYGAVSPDALGLWFPLITAVLGGVPAGLAVQNVNTTGTRPVVLEGQGETL